MEYGKFNSAEELLKGYTELEKSFTQKCQQLSALEKQYNSTSGTSEDDTPPQTDRAQNLQAAAQDGNAVPATKSADGTEVAVSVAQSEQTLAQLIKQYLDGHPEETALLLKDAQSVIPPKIMTSGGNASMALPSRPKTIREASEMAKEYFK